MVSRPFQTAFATAVAAVALALPLAGTVPPPVDCNALLPLVLNVGVPEPIVRAEKDGLGGVQDATRVLFQSLHRKSSCPERSLQVNLAIGNDYQILDWLGRGAVDVAIVPDLSLHLLQKRDGVGLLELAESSGLTEEVRNFLPGEEVRLRARHAGGGWRDLPEAEPHLGRFRERVLRCASDPACEPGAERAEYRLALPSHLSLASLQQVDETAAWLEKQLGQPKEDEADKALRERFWAGIFEHVRFTFDAASPGQPDLPGVTEIEAFVERDGGEPQAHLVFLARSVAKVFHPEDFVQAKAALPGRLQTLLDESKSFAALRKAEPYFGVRRFVFTIPESLALLRQHQRTSGKSSLALVLPGGGVKSIYQSRLIDELYGHRLLENVQVPGESESKIEPDHPLHVNYVMGTSGGALLGYFVARVGQKGPFDLTNILWRGRNGRFLESTEVFPWTDMPRYVSVLVILAVLAVLLMPLTRLRFRKKPLIPVSEHPRRADWRLGLGLFFWPLMLMTPILVRRINGLSVQEHIPVIEGIFYTVCTALAVFADQCLALKTEEEAQEPCNGPWNSVSPRVLLFLGAIFVLVALPVSSQYWLDLNVKVWEALVVILMLLSAVRYQLPAQRFRPGGRLAVTLQDCAAVMAVSIGLLAVGGRVFRRFDQLQIPGLLLGFVALLLVVVATPLMVARSTQRSGSGAWIGYALMVLAVATAVVLLIRPAEASSFISLLQEDSRLEIKLGSLLVCAGVLLLLLGVILWMARSPRYRIENPDGFLPGLLVCLLQIVLVFLVMWRLGEAWPATFPSLELTWGFWKWFLVVSLAAGLLLVVVGLATKSKRGFGILFEGLQYLCSHHQSGSGFVASRRILRIVGAACFAFAWWNFVLAPAFYGNGQARKFLDEVVVPRFQAKHQELYGEGRFEELTAPLVVTANRLDTDGTRYFLVVPRAAPACPPILQEPGSGAIWYSVLIPRQAGDPDFDPTACTNRIPLDAEVISGRIRRYVFASGSPFPVFPAHRVYLSDLEGEEQEDGKWPLVDGGYSNNVPIDGAVSLSAGQALILNSTPWETEEESGARRWSRSLRRIPGPLVGDLVRLPGFLFERSQQVDRLRKQELFVVSLTPQYRKGWPGLTDFRASVIADLRDYAEEDLPHRIGMVESWGPPSYQLSVQVGGGG